MKKLTALLLSLLLLLPCLARAEEAAAGTVYHPGDTFEASFDLISNPQNATFIMAFLSYDPSVFELLKSPAVTITDKGSGVSLKVNGSHLESGRGGISFKIKDQARPGTYVVKLNIFQAAGADNKNIPDAKKEIETSHLTITVRPREGEKRVYHPGDTVEAFFTVTDNPGKAMTATMKLAYDPAVFEPIASNVVRNDVISFVDKTGVIQVGVQQAVSFRILPTAADGTYTISMEITDARNENNAIVSDFFVSSVQVEVEKSETQKALEDARAEIAGLQKQLEALAGEKQSVQSALDAANAELDAARASIEGLTAQLTAAREEAAGLQTKLDQVNTGAKAAADKATDDMKAEQAKADALQAELDKAKADAATAAETAAKTLTDTKAQAAAELEQIKNEANAAAAAAAQALEDEKAAATAALAEQATKLKSAETDLEQLRAESTDTIEALKAQLANLQRQLDELTNTPVWGDINQDKIVDVSDVVLLQDYLAGGKKDAIDVNVCDVNGDGVFNEEDVDFLQAYVFSRHFGE